MSRYYLLTLLLLISFLPSRAQTADTLEQIVVTAGHLRKKRTEAPVAITQLTAGDLKEANAASLDQVLNKASGVFMVKLGNEQHSMSIRQPLSYKSLFLYLEDGIPIRPSGVFNHNALIEMNMTALRNIEVVKGPSSAVHGSEAIGGSVNFLSGSAPALPEAYFSVQGDNLGYK
ncbi:MAG TPA: TonB-dependent receptor plug domain-containing protein, partial [Anseongella sp.]|nr:TonB-dependent receptor plug domain-containing protein [Anseongella sp.]